MGFNKNLGSIMAKNYFTKKRKSLIAMLCALSVTCTGLAAACAPSDNNDDPTNEVTAKEDVQLLKNGNFEHFDIPDKAIHLIKNVNSWSLGGDTSVKSGIIGTSKTDWDKLTADDLAEKLDFNNDLTTDNEEYVNYNSMRSRDLLYKDNGAAMLATDDVKDTYWLTDIGYENYFGITGNDDDGYKIGETVVYKNADDGEYYLDPDFVNSVRKQMISNPGTHWGDFEEKDGKTYYGEKQVYADEAGRYYFDESLKENAVGNVLMIHNSPTDTKNNNGLHQYYTSTTVTLEAQTSAEISLWVKTSDLRFDHGTLANENEIDLGAYIEVIQTVAGTTVDDFQIKAINTEKILAGATDTTLKENNGWIQYTVYVNACDFANTTVQLRLGLGSSENNEKVTGYAFFDDVQITKYRDLEATDTDCTYNANKQTIIDNNTSCNLTSEEDAKIFYADKAGSDNRHAYDFHYLIDLASENGVEGSYNKYDFGKNVSAGLTTETDSHGVEYSAAESIANGVISSSIGTKTQGTLKLPKDVKSRPTSNDVIGAYALNYAFKSSDFNGTDYSKVLNEGLKGVNKLPAADGNMLVTFSAWGAPYTSTISDASTFSLDKDGYLLVSFWVKTSDMDGGTAATVKIYELDKETNLPDEDSAQTLTLDTTDMTTDFEDEKDIYNGWVQCFFFVKNETKDAKQFHIDFSFGNTAITTATSFEGGWAALANMRTLEINEDVYNLASAGNNTALFSFSKNADDDEGTPFDKATGTSNIKEEVAVPDSYTGRNGTGVSGTLVSGNLTAGLINKDYIDGYANGSSILTSFANGTANWENAFGNKCYQPLIIINNLREYAEKATANETNFKNYWVKEGDNYVKVASDATFSEDETYYSLSKVSNYGFIGESKTVAANTREVISTRVKVTGNAKAYIYLVDSETNEILNYATPAYTFWYDEEGNVLDEEFDEDWTTAKHREHVVYTLRDDGLYDGKDGKVYANLHNLVKTYKASKYEHNDFFAKVGDEYVAVSFDDLKDGETYYSDKNGTVADHYLCNSDGTDVYEYKDGNYFYIENHKTTTEVNNFEETYARYKNPDIDERLYVEVTKADCDKYGDSNGWVTVNFVIATGSESKGYRLELWSGERNKTGVDASDNYLTGAVAFDYSFATVSDTRLAAYEAEIIQAYHNLLLSKNDASLFEGISSGTKENVASYEKAIADLVAAGKLTEAEVKAVKDTYNASYYSYTLYDSASYVPFNVNTAADGETGYNYDPSLFNEQLAYLTYNDESRNEMNVFVDYTAVDQDISMNTSDGDDDEEEEKPANSAELGLYISSIVLVVVLLITLVSILVTQYVKKRRKAKGTKNSEKNVYRKRDRYVKKLHLVKDELVDPEAPAESASAEEPVEESTDAPAPEAPAEESAEPSTEAAPEVEDAPAEPSPTDDSSDENKE